MKKSVRYIAVLTLLVLCTLQASAAVLFSSGQYRIENSEFANFEYHGLVQCNSNSIYQNQRAQQGYIGYKGGKGGDTGRLYTAISNGTTVTRTKVYYDLLQLNPPKTVFYWGFDWYDKNIEYTVPPVVN